MYNPGLAIGKTK